MEDVDWQCLSEEDQHDEVFASNEGSEEVTINRNTCRTEDRKRRGMVEQNCMIRHHVVVSVDHRLKIATCCNTRGLNPVVPDSPPSVPRCACLPWNPPFNTHRRIHGLTLS